MNAETGRRIKEKTALQYNHPYRAIVQPHSSRQQMEQQNSIPCKGNGMVQFLEDIDNLVSVHFAFAECRRCQATLDKSKFELI